MHMTYLAHNGVSHSTSAEQASHGSRTLLMIGLISLVVAVVLLATIRFLGRTETVIEEAEDKHGRS